MLLLYEGTTAGGCGLLVMVGGSRRCAAAAAALMMIPMLFSVGYLSCSAMTKNLGLDSIVDRWDVT